VAGTLDDNAIAAAGKKRTPRRAGDRRHAVAGEALEEVSEGVVSILKRLVAAPRAEHQLAAHDGGAAREVVARRGLQAGRQCFVLVAQFTSLPGAVVRREGVSYYAQRVHFQTFCRLGALGRRVGCE
jgi:hypothetical protein